MARMRVALITPASLRHPDGDSLRPMMQALGLWRIGFRDFVVYTPEPNDALVFPQERLVVRGPLKLVKPFDPKADIVHAHQNSGLMLEGRVWADMHGFAPLESRMALRGRPLRWRNWIMTGYSQWATSRLVRRCERVICASESIQSHVRRQFGEAPQVSVVRNAIDPEVFEVSSVQERIVGVVGGFTGRWGRPAFELALQVAHLAPEVSFRFVGGLTDGQRRAAAITENVEILGYVDDEEMAEFWKQISVLLVPYPAWCVGGGARQKLLMGAASGLSIVATPAGIEGFDRLPQLCVGTTAGELAAHVRMTLAEPGARRERGDAMRRHVESHHHYLKEAEKLAALYEQAL